MRRLLRLGAAFGLCVLFIGPHSPVAASAVSPAIPQAVVLPAFALAVESASAAPGFAMTVSPTRLVIGQADIGKQQTIRVANGGESAVDIAVQKRNFTAGPDGVASYVATAPYSASEWITTQPASFRLAAGTSQNVSVTVDVPSNPEPGDHQMALIFLAPSAQSGGNIKINQGIGMSVYITVPGPIIESVALSDLSAPGFATGGPIPITAIVHNVGTVHKDYRGDSPLVVDVPGGATVFPDFTVPRDSVRNISVDWNPPLIGIFNPTVTVTSADGATQSQSVQVIVFPIQKALILVGAILLIFFGFLFFRRRYRASVTKAAVAMNRPAGRGDD